LTRHPAHRYIFHIVRHQNNQGHSGQFLVAGGFRTIRTWGGNDYLKNVLVRFLNDEEIVMNTSYNYADFIGLNLDSSPTHKDNPHPVDEEKINDKHSSIDSSKLTATQAKQRPPK
jgi:hypothetical protein